MIRLLTAEEPIGWGGAAVGGHDVSTAAEKCWQSLGFCPQHDALWPELSVREHLMLFAELKGQPDTAAAASSMLAKLDLELHAEKQSKNL